MQELVQDIISILHVFSCKLYGLRKYKKQIKEDKEIAKGVTQTEIDPTPEQIVKIKQTIGFVGLFIIFT